MFSINNRIDKVLSTFTNAISDLNRLSEETDSRVSNNEVKIDKLSSESDELIAHKERAERAVSYLGKIVGGNV